MPRSALSKAREAPSSTKARILAAAEEVFAAKGFAGASTREIAAAGGVNISSLHYHWESKETLYFAVFENIYDRIVDLVRALDPGRRRAAGRAVRWSTSVGGPAVRLLCRQPQRPEAAGAPPARDEESTSDIERDILAAGLAAVRRLDARLQRPQAQGVDSQLFMLTVHTVLLLFLLDSQQFTSLLGGSVRSPEVRRRVRAHIIKLVHMLHPRRATQEADVKALITASFTADGLRRACGVTWTSCTRTGATKQAIYFDGAEFAARINEVGADVLIVEADLVHDEVLDACRLRLIGCCRGDPINIGIERATALGIPVLFAPARNADAVADLTLGFMLALARNIFTVNGCSRPGRCASRRPRTTSTCTSATAASSSAASPSASSASAPSGARVAQRLHGFGSRVAGLRSVRRRRRVRRAPVRRPLPLDELAARRPTSSPCTVRTCPRTTASSAPAQIRSLKRGAYVLNLARAAIVDDDALYEALRDGHLAGAALDVFARRAGAAGQSLRAAAERAGLAASRRRDARRRPPSDRHDRRRHRSVAARRAPAPHRQSGSARSS